MNLHATQLHESEPNGDPASPGAAVAPSPASPATGRFAYATGARPLAGYTIKRGIGHGGFGEVYYATSDAGKEVALKLIRRNWDVELRGVTQCLNLKHPNLLSLFDIKQDEHGDNWVVMELMSGDSLEELLAKNPHGLPEAEALAWIHGIAAGVAYLHDHGIVHRDLKPGNIFVDEGIVKIGDYGLSKFISCSRRSGQTGSVGTVHYMAPEIANGRYGKEIDIYAVGIILYEMLTGHVPFEGESVGEILMKHLTAEPDLNRLAEPYRTIVSRCLAKDPAKRFASLNELIALLPPVPVGGSTTANAARFVGPTATFVAGKFGQAPINQQGGNPQAPFPQGVNPQAGNPQTAGMPFGGAAGAGAAQGQRAQPAQPLQDGDQFNQWVHQTKSEFTTWWERKNFHPWQKLLIILAAAFVLLRVFVPVAEGFEGAAFHGRTPTAVWIAIAVALFLVFRNRDRQKRGSANNPYRGSSSTSPPPLPPKYQAAGPAGTPVAATATASAAANPYRPLGDLRESPTRRRWKRWSSSYNYQPAPPRERFTQLVGSLLLSAVGCLIVSLVVLILRGETPDPAQYGWLAISSVLGSWAVLVPAKVWEGRRGDPVLRRFVMLVVGLGFGVVAFGLYNWLMAPIHYDENFQIGPGRDLHQRFFVDGNDPRLIAFLAYFGFLFFIPRWWPLADPVRKSRLSIWNTLVKLGFAWLVGFFWPFPQPWGWMTAATIAISVQLAAPWLSPEDRLQLAQKSTGV